MLFVVAVFKYDPLNSTTFPHSVYLLEDLWSFIRCDLRRARLVGNVTQGGGKGFEFVLKEARPHYFACGERQGIHCKEGLTKFCVAPEASIQWLKRGAATNHKELIICYTSLVSIYNLTDKVTSCLLFFFTCIRVFLLMVTLEFG